MTSVSSLWSNIKLGALFTGTCGVLAVVLSWTHDESEEVKKARDVVAEADKKRRVAKIASFLFGVASVYGVINLTEYLLTRPRPEGRSMTADNVIPTEHLYSE